MRPNVGPGCPAALLDTPALVVELDALERNIQKIAGTCRRHGVSWRPHVKGQKVPAIAHKALAAGAIGVTCAKVSEAEVMAAAGIPDILIANQVVGPAKLLRLAELCRGSAVTVAIDHPVHVAALEEAASDAGVQIGVVIEVDIGIGRAGVAPGAAVPTFGAMVARHPHLRFRGVMGWEGHTTAIPELPAKQAAVSAAVRSLVASANLCRESGLPVDVVSCGGTGTYWLTAQEPGVTEIQAGGGVFCDVRYRRVFGVDHEYALTVLTTVTSRPNPQRVICDAGRKTMSDDAAAPEPLGIKDVRSVKLSAEHTTIELSAPHETPAIGDKVSFVVGYSDSTVHLSDTLIVVRDGNVEAVWPITARGKTQ